MVYIWVLYVRFICWFLGKVYICVFRYVFLDMVFVFFIWVFRYGFYTGF